MKRSIKYTVASLVFSLLPSLALAAPVTYSVMDNISGSVYVPPATTGSFDLSGILNTYSNPEILGGTATFLFNDDANDLSTSTSTNGYSYWYTTYPNGIWNYQIRYKRTSTTTNIDEYESFYAEVGDDSASGSTNYFNTGSVHTGTTFNYANYNINYWGDDKYFYTASYLQSYGYTGNVSLSLTLDAEMITEILSTGALGFEVGSLSGDGWFTGAALSITVDEGVVQSSSAAVPEPSILALMGLGLAGLGFARQRKMKA